MNINVQQKSTYNGHNENNNFEKIINLNEHVIKTTQNKLENNFTKNKENEYDLLEMLDDIKIYKYSNIKSKSPYKLIFQYFFDKYESTDYKNSKIILFIGKTGDGKTTAINAIFNILKGIKLEDNYRFILIKESIKDKGQSESQTDGLHLYYIKDKNNNPLIIVDCQGFGDTRGKIYDELIKESFQYIFNNIIFHIDLICFISNSTNLRITPLTKYIFSFSTSLFSNDLYKNFIIISTFANKDTIKNGPLYIDSIQKDDFFKEIIEKMDKKWWYAVDSLCLFDDEINNKLCKYTYSQFNYLYEEKINNSIKIDIKKSSEIINIRKEFKIKILNIISNYKKISFQNQNINEINKKINEQTKKINIVNNQIEYKNEDIKYIYVPDKDLQIKQIEDYRNKIINELDNQYNYYTVRRYRYVGGVHTTCRYCEANCHSPCYCLFFFRCKIFNFLGYCVECGHSKSNHNIHKSYKYVNENEKSKIDNSIKIKKEKEYFWQKYDEIIHEYNKMRNIKENKEREINNLKKEKNQLNDQKYYYINEKEKINNIIKETYKDISSFVLDLINMNEIIKKYGMNQQHCEIENVYIDTLLSQVEQNNCKDSYDKIEKLKEYKRYNDIFKILSNISAYDLKEKGVKFFIDKIEKYLY